MSKDSNPKNEEFTGLKASALVLSICNTYRELITPDAPITPATVTGSQFNTLVRFMEQKDAKGILGVYTTAIGDGLKQTTSANKMSKDYLEKFNPFFKNVVIQKSIDSLRQDIATLVNSWYLPNNPTKKEISPLSVKLSLIQELIARKTKANVMPNLVHMVGGNFSYNMKHITDMDKLETIKTEIEKALK